MVILDNNVLHVEICEKGAEIQQIIVGGQERLWNGNPDFWTGRSPVMFPICGGLKNDKFTYNGKEYILNKHGFAKNSVFEVERKNELSAVFLLKDSSETLKQYPWHFEFRVIYTLRSGCLNIEFNVKNTSDNTMYFSVGAHEAYACPEGIEDYDIIFEKKETLNSCDLVGNLIGKDTYPIIKETDTLPLYYKYFAKDALVFKDLKSKTATLRNRKTGKTAYVDFHGFDYFLLWTKPGAGYICMEPWSGIPPMIDSGYDITEKEGISSVLPNEVFCKTHTIYFE